MPRLKSGITYAISHNYAKIKIDSSDFLPLEETLTLHNVIIIIKPLFNKDQNHYYYNVFSEKNHDKNVFDSIIMLRSDERKVAKEGFYGNKKPIKIWDVDIDDIAVSILIEKKTNFKYLIGYLDKVIRPLVLTLPKMSGYVKTLNVKS